MSREGTIPEDTTRDALLDGRVNLTQPREGYRAAVDPVLLAAAVGARPGQRALDLGTGVGAAALCLAARVPGLEITGLELQPELAELARRNVAANGMGDAVRILEGDLLRPPPELEQSTFDHVMANPPYQEADRGNPPPDGSKARANVEGEADLLAWASAAFKFLRRKGVFTVIHRADRLDAVLAVLHGRFGDIAVLPLWPHAGQPAKRVLVQARKGVLTPTRLLPGLVLHADDGAWLPEADAVIRGAAPLPL